VNTALAPRRRGPRHRIRRSHRRTWLALLVVVVVLGSLGAAAAIRLAAGPPHAKVRATLAARRVVAGSAGVPAWPAGVQAAFSIPVLGISEESGPEHAAPVASLTKTMTAYLVLRDHPLSGSDQGPLLTMTAADVADWENANATDQSNVEVTAGELLSERQLLEGLLVHSANNFADILAAWDAGSIPAFVQKMNATAHVLGMRNTTFVDASGFNQQSQSTPSDLLRVVGLDMQFPVFAQIVTMSSVTLPVAGTVASATPLVGAPGILGVKSGFTMAAGGCDILALLDRVDNQFIVVLGAVTGEQQGDKPVGVAGLAALALAKSVAQSVVGVQVARVGTVFAKASVAGSSVPAGAAGSRALLAWPGQVIESRFIPVRPPLAGARAHSVVGHVVFSVARERVSVLVRTARALPRPTLFQRLL
jgi:D-alanyl-D-alanine carboxypeptidase (penicillin-binding protein 5/6)